MGEDFQAGVCGSTWWSSPRGSIGLSPCNMGINDFRWPSHDLMVMKARSSALRDVPDLSDQGSFLFDQYMQKPSGGSLIDSTLQMMDISGSSTTISTADWSQNHFSGSGGSETNNQSPMVQENMSASRLSFRQEPRILNSPNNQIQKECSAKTFSHEGAQDSTINELNQTSITTQGFSLGSSLPMTSSSYGYPSTLIENLFGDDQLLLENQAINFPSTMNYRTNLNVYSRSLEKLPPSLIHPQQKQQESNPMHLTSNSSFWNASTAAPSDITATIFSSTQAPMIERLNSHNFKPKSNIGVNQVSKKSCAEPAFKRPRIETPSSLPTFKVRKEKLGDHITALQQLVSPFGKTDTASVLQEAIEYIKFLHDQVNVLSTPYMKNGAPIQQQENDNSKNPEGAKQDLKSRGLCLVPISSTFPVANETTADFWTPTFEGHSDREHIQTSLNNAIFCPYIV